MKRFVIVYLSTLVILLPLDLIFLGAIGKKLFADNVGDMTLRTPRMAPAILFYVLYLAGVVIFVNGAAPSNWMHNLQYGALFGLFCYATFELTNMALLKHWEWAVVVPDIAWGAVLTAVSAAIGGLISGWVLARIWLARYLSANSKSAGSPPSWPAVVYPSGAQGAALWINEGPVARDADCVTLGLGPWIVYGVLRSYWVINSANAIGAILAAIVLGCKLYDREQLRHIQQCTVLIGG